MKISALIPETAILPDLKSHDKTAVLKEISEAIHQQHETLPEAEIYQLLSEREKLGSTGIGNGVAIPHGKHSKLDHLIVVFARSRDGVNFESQDGEPTHLFFVLIAPEDSAGLHLKALAKLSRLLKNPDFRKRLQESPDAKSLAQVIVEEDEKH